MHPSRSTRKLATLRGVVIGIDHDRRACWNCAPGRGLCSGHRARFRTVVVAITAARTTQAVTEVAA